MQPVRSSVKHKTQVPQPFALHCPSFSQIYRAAEWPLFESVTRHQIQQAGQSAFLSVSQTYARAGVML